mmetsp:Transcript_11485/g.22567  ORF Transcript_11485/g.22567 Transcript_11485/m.22567 type:complete len:308 (-) Transcript_11485:1210-2133(-)
MLRRPSRRAQRRLRRVSRRQDRPWVSFSPTFARSSASVDPRRPMSTPKALPRTPAPMPKTPARLLATPRKRPRVRISSRRARVGSLEVSLTASVRCGRALFPSCRSPSAAMRGPGMRRSRPSSASRSTSRARRPPMRSLSGLRQWIRTLEMSTTTTTRARPFGRSLRTPRSSSPLNMRPTTSWTRLRLMPQSPLTSRSRSWSAAPALDSLRRPVTPPWLSLIWLPSRRSTAKSVTFARRLRSLDSRLTLPPWSSLRKKRAPGRSSTIPFVRLPSSGPSSALLTLMSHARHATLPPMSVRPLRLARTR